MRCQRASRLLVLPAAVCAGLLAGVLASAPALASPSTGPGDSSGPTSGGGSTGGGCSGASCYAQVWQYIHVTGDASAPGGGTGGAAVAMPPPPCYLQPEWGGPQLYQMWQQTKNEKVGPNGEGTWAGFPGGPAAIKAHQNDTDGEWWGLVINLSVSGNCSINPYIQWVPDGTPPPLPQVPEIDLADYAYNHMTIKSPTLKFSPATRSIVNLPTYVWAREPQYPDGVARVTATLGNESSTVTATASKLQLGISGSGTIYQSGCTASGSTAPDPPKNAGPGTTPDCGVVFNAPGGDSITGSLAWTPVGAGHTFPDINVGTTAPVTVAEIQNLNN